MKNGTFAEALKVGFNAEQAGMLARLGADTRSETLDDVREMIEPKKASLLSRFTNLFTAPKRSSRMQEEVANLTLLLDVYNIPAGPIGWRVREYWAQGKRDINLLRYAVETNHIWHVNYSPDGYPGSPLASINANALKETAK